MKTWLRAMVEDVKAETRTNPPSDASPVLELQLKLKEAGAENDVSEHDMREALTEFGVTDEVEVEEALEQFASWL